MMTIEEWEKETLKDLELFIGWFKKNQIKEPELFPRLLSHGEWDEQFQIFSS